VSAAEEAEHRDGPKKLGQIIEIPREAA